MAGRARVGVREYEAGAVSVKKRASVCAPHRRRAGAARVARHHCALRLVTRLWSRPIGLSWDEINELSRSF